MSAITTRAPSRANRTAAARPIPQAPPLTNATRPARRMGQSALMLAVRTTSPHFLISDSMFAA